MIGWFWSMVWKVSGCFEFGCIYSVGFAVSATIFGILYWLVVFGLVSLYSIFLVIGLNRLVSMSGLYIMV